MHGDSATGATRQCNTPAVGRSGRNTRTADNTSAVPTAIIRAPELPAALDAPDAPDALSALDALYDRCAARTYTQLLRAMPDRARAESVMETVFGQMARLLPHLSPTADLEAVLDRAVQQAIADQPDARARGTRPTATSYSIR